MKRIICYALVAGTLLTLSGCADIWDALSNSSSSDSDSGSYDTSTATETEVTATYRSGSVITVAPSTKRLTVSGNLLGGKTIYLAKTNPTGTLITKDYTCYIENVSSNITLYTSSRAAEAQDAAIQDAPHYCGFVHQDFSFPTLDSSARAASSATTIIDRSNSQLELDVDVTKKDIWMEQTDNWSSAKDFKEKSTTLRAKGTYCNVWVDNDCYTTGEASGKKITSAMAEEMATYFDAIHNLETKLWGAESDKIIYYDSAAGDFTTKPITYLDDTGGKVNLVVMDVGNTYNSRTGKDEGSTLGYFAPKDYFPDTTDIRALGYNDSWSYGHSNEGKYLYINAATCVSAPANLRTIITHEYQHLITFGLQTMALMESRNILVTSGSAYYEMMAMVGEDFIKEYTKANYADFTNDNTPFAWRLPNFNAGYYLSGIEYNQSSSSAVSISYAVNYTFGAWLARKYGGAKLMHYMEINPAVSGSGSKTSIDDYATIVNAVNWANNTSETMETLLREFAYDCVIPNSISGTNGLMKSTSLASTDSLYCSSPAYAFPLRPVDLWNLSSYISVTDSNKNALTGPTLLAYNNLLTYGVRPYGMELNKIGTIATGATSITLTFNDRSASTLKTYLIIE